MLDAGADPSLLYFNADSGAPFSNSSYSMELWFGPLQTLKALLDKSAPLVTPNSTGNPGFEEVPLLIIARSSSYNNHIDTAEKFVLLIERGADANVYDKHGSNALHIVMRYMPLQFDKRALEELYDILMILVTARAWVYRMNQGGETVSDVAVANGYRDLWIRVLEDCGYDADMVMKYRKGPGVPRPTQRTKLSFKEYCQRRASPTCLSRVVGVGEIEPANIGEVCIPEPLCYGPMCCHKVSDIPGDRWNCAVLHGADFCANCESFIRLIQFTYSDGKCGNANVKNGEIQDEQHMIREYGHEPFENGNFQNHLLGINESENDTRIGIEHDEEDFVPPSSIDLEDFGFDAREAESEERDFMRLFIIDDWD
jgi:hypothetical protein